MDVIFGLVLLIDGWAIFCEIALKYMALDIAVGKSTLVQVMAWCSQATSHYISQCWPRSLLPCGVTRPQRVNMTVDIGINFNGLNYATFVWCQVISWVTKVNTCHHTLHAIHWHHLWEIPPIIATGVKSNIKTVNEVHRFIVNMFYYGRIHFTRFKHSDVKSVR